MEEIGINNKIYFAEEKRPYTVKAVKDNFAICTKPFNPKKTVLYSILDFKTRKRSTDNYVFSPFDYTKISDINECLNELLSGKCELSRRNQIDLNIVKII